MQKTNTSYEQNHTDDFSVLNYLIEHVKGLSPSSMVPDYALDDVADE